MHLKRFTDAAEFLAHAPAWFEQNELPNNLLVGVAMRIAEHPERVKAQPYFALVDGPAGPLAAALQTPPLRLILFANEPVDRRALELICDDAMTGGMHLPGVIAPADAARAFAEVWAERTGRSHKVGLRTRLYGLRQVATAALEEVPGRLRQATPDDIPLVADWILQFFRDAHLPGTLVEAREAAVHRVSDGLMFLWEHGAPVSMAARTRHTPHGAIISFVYTPPDLRRRGYATACVGKLSQRLIDEGWRFCALFADLANPTSNDIYLKIGYVPVCDFAEYDFEGGTDP